MENMNNGMDKVNTSGGLHIVYGDTTLGVSGKDFHYIFSWEREGLESLVTGGHEWLYRSPRPTFWRAVTDNDRGNRFPLRSGMWLAADMFMRCSGYRVWIDGEETQDFRAPANNRFNGDECAQRAAVEFSYETITEPSTTVTVRYEVEESGRMGVEVHYYGKAGLPELPVFGMRFVMPTKASSYRYQGLSGETYPDRMAGGIPGVYEVEGLPVTPYLVPQDCGMHMNTEWVEIRRSSALNNADKTQEPFTLTVQAKDMPFAFSCLPYTAQELENATHMEELPPARRTVLTVLGAVRGVGGIDSWGADVEEAFHIDGEKDICYSFYLV